MKPVHATSAATAMEIRKALGIKEDGALVKKLIKGRKKMQPGAGKRKGSSFERDFCKLLSLWWTDNQDKDVFWRTHSSGGKKGVNEEAGDVMAIKDIGRPLTRKVVFELKNVSDKDLLLDLIRDSKKSKIVEWLNKLEEEAAHWGRDALLVIKLSNRTTICIFRLGSLFVKPNDFDAGNLLWNGRYLITELNQFLQLTTLKDGGR